MFAKWWACKSAGLQVNQSQSCSFRFIEYPSQRLNYTSTLLITHYLNNTSSICEGVPKVRVCAAAEQLASIQKYAHGPKDGKVKAHDQSHVKKGRKGGHQGRQYRLRVDRARAKKRQGHLGTGTHGTQEGRSRPNGTQKPLMLIKLQRSQVMHGLGHE